MPQNRYTKIKFSLTKWWRGNDASLRPMSDYSGEEAHAQEGNSRCEASCNARLWLRRVHLSLCGTQLVFEGLMCGAAVWGGHPAGVSMPGPPWSVLLRHWRGAQHLLHQYCQTLQLHMKDLGNPVFKKDFFFLNSRGETNAKLSKLLSMTNIKMSI